MQGITQRKPLIQLPDTIFKRFRNNPAIVAHECFYKTRGAQDLSSRDVENAL